jgi:putative endonuclease
MGEKLACEFLGQNGYKILETNYRCPGGEIDIIAQQKDTLVFIEVRTKTSRKFGGPEESITPVKAARLRTLAAHYGQNHDNLPEAVGE